MKRFQISDGLGVLALLAIVVWYGISAMPPGGLDGSQSIRFYLRSGLYLDDAFYYFKTAQNLFYTGSISFDLINPTNGFHPLWFLICIPLAALLSPNELLVTVTWIELLLYFGASFVLARGMARSGWVSLAMTVLFLAVFSYNNALRTVLNGLETSLHVFLLACSLLALKIYFERKKSAALFIIFPLLFLSRIESILFCAIAILLIIYLERRKVNPKIYWLTLCMSSVLFLYILVNYLTVGEFFPVSGSAKRVYANFVHMSTIANNEAIWKVWIGYFAWVLNYPWIFALVCLNCAAAIIFIWRREYPGFLLSTYCILKFVGYVVGYKSSAGAYLWYYAPDFLSATYFIGWCTLKAFHAKKLLTFMVASVFAFWFFIGENRIFLNDMRHHGMLLASNVDPKVGNELDMFYLSAGLVNKLSLSKDTILGMHNCGVFGYFSNYRVVNMDGLINGSARLDYIKKYGYDWLPYIDEKQAIDGYLDLIPTQSLDALNNALNSREFFSYPLQDKIVNKYVSTLIPPEQSKMALFLKHSTWQTVNTQGVSRKPIVSWHD